ncbi:hypothetical protein [Medusavirus stheno T3]|uniref:Uncharacterized protein n=1 Tax=Medusavirus stheno T3 TaxID=3069717 RepID=A0A7S7YER8_9VIRU|nr:hypothetical protein QKU73_gp316 [Acanthamoeba castellanii medusavirus]QPB44459.1 hypothetical protein [Medusavirus stheno T3]
MQRPNPCDPPSRPSPSRPTKGFWERVDNFFFGESPADATARRWREYNEECRREDCEWQRRLSRRS